MDKGREAFASRPFLLPGEEALKVTLLRTIGGFERD
jgi:hypothetical protein